MWLFQKNNKGTAKKKTGYYITVNDRTGEREVEALADKVREALHHPFNKKIIFLCIGSDRSTGDSLGPLVGTMLKERLIPYPVYGTLEEPVHALNIEEVLNKIYKTYVDPLVFGIDACLSKEKETGFILFKEEPFTPGKALNQCLPEVGDLHLKVVVNDLNPLSPVQSLNNTRLYTVMNLAKVITNIITKALAVEKVFLN